MGYSNMLISHVWDEIKFLSSYLISSSQLHLTATSYSYVLPLLLAARFRGYVSPLRLTATSIG